MKFFKCKECDSFYLSLSKPSCSNAELVELEANTVDAAVEKHVPVMVKEGNKVTIKVGEVAHPMVEAHYIEWIALETSNGYYVKRLNPEEKPEAVFALLPEEKDLKAYAYCNLHGLWMATE